jgi:hypothetical protein
MGRRMLSKFSLRRPKVPRPHVLPMGCGNGRGVADHRHQFPVSPRQNPFSTLWKVTRSTRPARASWVGDAAAAFMQD